MPPEQAWVLGFCLAQCCKMCTFNTPVFVICALSVNRIVFMKLGFLINSLINRLQYKILACNGIDADLVFSI